MYDPSLPPVFGIKDQLIQVVLNLVKNAAESIGDRAIDGEISMTTGYRSGVRMQVPGATGRVALPLELCIRDNGPGVPPELMPNLFDPFVTTKANGSWPRSCFGRQADRRSWRRHRVRVATEPNSVPHPAPHVQGAGWANERDAEGLIDAGRQNPRR